MTFEEFEYKWCESRDKVIKYREDGKCLFTICSECEHQNACEEMKNESK